MTSDLAQRMWQHKSGEIKGFTKTYGVHILVHAEYHETMLDAISREKQIKHWRRPWKLELIERGNPAWRDLCNSVLR